MIYDIHELYLSFGSKIFLRRSLLERLKIKFHNKGLTAMLSSKKSKLPIRMNKSTPGQLIIPPVFIVAFSGHRPKAGTPGRSPEKLAACQPLIQQALADFQKQAATVGGTIHLLTSVAEGADLAACAAAEELSVPLHLILPLPEHQFKDDFTQDSDAWASAQSYIHRARVGENGWTLRIAKSTHERTEDAPLNGPDCYADTNYEILSHADALVTVTIDFHNPSSSSGAEQVWQDASAHGLPRININPLTQSSSDTEDLENLVSEGNKRSGIKLLGELARYVEPLNYQGTSKCLTAAEKTFDGAAKKSARFVRYNLLVIIGLHGSASLLAAIAISYALTVHEDYKMALFVFAAIELLLIIIAEILHYRMHHKSEKWLQCRAATEALRMLGQVRTHFDPLFTLVEHHSPHLRRFILSTNLHCGHPERFHDIETAKKAYREDRIDDQIQYFKEKAAKASPWSQRLFLGMRASSVLALIVVAIAATNKGAQAFHLTDFHLADSVTLALYLLPVALPLLAGILLSFRQSFDLSRREYRYTQMVGVLEGAKDSLVAVHTPFALQQVITQVEESLLDERLEFEVSQRIGLEH